MKSSTVQCWGQSWLWRHICCPTKQSKMDKNRKYDDIWAESFGDINSRASVLANRESAAARPASLLLSLFMRWLTFVETTEQLVKILAAVAPHDWLQWRGWGRVCLNNVYNFWQVTYHKRTAQPALGCHMSPPELYGRETIPAISFTTPP